MSDRPLREATTDDLRGRRPFPDPVAVLSLRDCAVFRAVDDDDQPVLVITDGVTTVALECGLKGLTDEIVAAAARLADGVIDYNHSVRVAAAAHRG